MTSSRKTGDDAENFVANVLRPLNFLVEVHPRTFRLIHIKEGKTIQVSQDNDYYNNFDIKAERLDFMIYAQVKFESEKSNTSTAQRDIDKEYPHEFPYQRIQTWQVWKEWVKEPKRHKEYRFRIQERRGFMDVKRNGKTIKRGIWTEIDISDLAFHEIPEKSRSGDYETDE